MKDQLPLSDCIVVVTRAVHQAEPLVGSLEVLGAEVVHIPLIGISEPSDGGASMRAAVSNLDVYDWVVVTSTNGSDSLKASLVHFPPGGPLLAAIGSKTALSLSEGGFSVALVPTRSAAMSLLDEFPKLPECGGRVLVLRAELGRDTLPDGLREAGWQVDVVPAYRNVQPEVNPVSLRAARSANIVVFMSESAVRRYTALIGEPVPADAVCIGSATADLARSLGYGAVEADSYSVEGVIDTLCVLVNG